jgi:formyltetrahydrofolate synthetase
VVSVPEQKGCANLAHHIRNICKFGVAAVVAVNRYDCFRA